MPTYNAYEFGKIFDEVTRTGRAPLRKMSVTQSLSKTLSFRATPEAPMTVELKELCRLFLDSTDRTGAPISNYGLGTDSDEKRKLFTQVADHYYNARQNRQVESIRSSEDPSEEVRGYIETVQLLGMAKDHGDFVREDSSDKAPEKPRKSQRVKDAPPPKPIKPINPKGAHRRGSSG